MFNCGSGRIDCSIIRRISSFRFKCCSCCSPHAKSVFFNFGVIVTYILISVIFRITYWEIEKITDNLHKVLKILS